MSRTTRTRCIHLPVDQIEDVLLVIFDITLFDLINSEIKDATANSFVDEAGQVAFLATVAGEKGANCSVRFFRDGEVLSGHWSISAHMRIHIYVSN